MADPIFIGTLDGKDMVRQSDNVRQMNLADVPVVNKTVPPTQTNITMIRELKSVKGDSVRTYTFTGADLTAGHTGPLVIGVGGFASAGASSIDCTVGGVSATPLEFVIDNVMTTAAFLLDVGPDGLADVAFTLNDDIRTWLNSRLSMVAYAIQGDGTWALLQKDKDNTNAAASQTVSIPILTDSVSFVMAGVQSGDSVTGIDFTRVAKAHERNFDTGDIFASGFLIETADSASEDFTSTPVGSGQSGFTTLVVNLGAS